MDVPGDLETGDLAVGQATGDGVRFDPRASAVDRTGPRMHPIARSIACRPRTAMGLDHDLVPLPHTRSTWWPLLTEVGDVRARGLENPEAEQAEHGHQGEVVRVGSDLNQGAAVRKEVVVHREVLRDPVRL